MFLSCVSTLTRDINITILSVRPTVRLSVRYVPVLDNSVSNTSQKFRDGFLAVSASNTEVEEPLLEIARRW